MQRPLRAIVVGIALGAFGCSKSEPAPPAPAVLPPVPPPPGLVAELVMPHPGTTWSTARAAIGGPAALLPQSGGMLVGSLLGLPPGAVALLDVELPALGAVVAGDHGFVTVVALHVKDGAKLAELVSTGDNARFTKKPDAASGVVLLDPKGNASTLTASMAVVGNYLALGVRPDDLVRYAPYVARTLPARAVPKDGDLVAVANGAGVKVVAARGRETWDAWKKEREADDAAMRQKHGGSAPDFGDPSEALAHFDQKNVSRLFGILNDLDEARLVATVDGGFVHVRLSMKPAPGTGVAAQEIGAMTIGDATPLLALPAASPIALLTRDSAAARAASAADESEALAKVFGGRLAAADKGKIDAALSAWAKGRGDWLTAFAVWSKDTHAAVVRGAVADAAVLDEAVGSFLGLSQIPAIAEPLASFAGEMKLSRPVKQGALRTVHVSRKEPKLKLAGSNDSKSAGAKGEPTPDDVDVVWTVNDEGLLAAAGRDAKGALGALSAKGDKTLGDVPEIAKLGAGLGGDISFALLVQPMHLVATAVGKDDVKPQVAPVLFAYGRTGPDGWFELDASTLLAREWAKAKGGL